MKDKMFVHKLGNVVMLVVLLATVFIPTVYNASEVTRGVVSTQVSRLEEEEMASEVSEVTNEQEADDETSEVIIEEEDSDTEANAPPTEKSREGKEDEVIDLSNMSTDEIAEALDPDNEAQNFITLSPEQLKEVRGVSITEVTASEDFSVVNSSIWGEWGVYRANGHFIFCIQPGADVDSPADETTQSGSIYNNFSATTKDYLGMVISSSMQHYADSKNKDYIFAGQLLIWDYLSDHERSVLGNPKPENPYFLDSWTIHNSSEYGSAISKIESDLDEWTVIPSFMGTQSNPKKHTLKYNASTDSFSITLTDTNGVWDDKFADYGNFGDYTVTNPAGADNVKITTSVENTSYSSTRTYAWKPYLSGTAEFYDAGQDLVYVGSDPVVGAMKLKTERRPLGGFQSKKVDSETGAALEGAVFKVYEDPNNNGKIDEGESAVKTITSDSKGILSTGGKTILEGNYVVKETTAPVGYVKSDKLYDIHITDDVIKDYTDTPWKNDIIRGGFSLTKLGEVYELEPEELEGIEFEVTSSTYPDFDKVYTTDKEGKIVTEDDELKYGDYHIEEINAPSRFVIDFEQDFSIRKDGVIVQLNGGDDILNELYMNRVHITKVAENLDNTDHNLYPLEGATFGIYQDVGEANGEVDRQDILIDMQVTDENGEFTSVEFQEGSYYVKEIETPEGYNLNPTAYPFTVANDGTLEDGATQDLGEVKNEVITGTATLTKVGSKECDKSTAKPGEIKDCQTPLDGVSFAIYHDLNGDGQWGRGEDKPLQVITTDEDGVATTDVLKYGTYFVKEVDNPRDNYYMNDNMFTFNITNQDEVVAINNGVAIENIEKLGNVHITKSGNEIGNLKDDTVFLADAEYTIYNADGEKEDVLVTDENGEATSVMLSFGDYTMQETKAPEGYVLDETVYEFTIDNESYEETIEFDLTDEVIENEIEVKKVDFATGEEVAGAHLEVIDANTDEVIEEWVSTEEEHELSLEYGQYEFVETIAPEGYQKLNQGIEFEVTEDGIVQHFEIENKLIPDLATTGFSSKVYVLTGILTTILITLLALKKTS